MVAGSATLVQGCERSFSGQGPGLVSKCSAEVLDGQLVSAVLRSSVVLYARLHELQLSAYNCTFCYIGSSFYTDAQTL